MKNPITSAALAIHVYVACPHCGYLFSEDDKLEDELTMLKGVADIRAQETQK